jgi:hypothetical protein
MWPFRRKDPSPDLLERIDALERGHKRMRLEWEETYDKVARMMGRIAKRAKLDETREDAPGSTIPGGMGADPMSQAILARRRRGLLPNNGG